MAPRHRACRRRRAGQVGGPRTHRRCHGAQARRAGPAAERAEVLRSLPSRTRGDSAAAGARRDEEHVPRSRVARPAYPAHVDPRVGGHARAIGNGHPREDAIDLLQRIASNARKARTPPRRPAGPRPSPAGIITPQRRRTDAGALVGEAVREFEQFGGREVLFGSGELMADVDPPKVERIVENLLERGSAHHPESRIWAGWIDGTTASCWSSRTRAAAYPIS